MLSTWDTRLSILSIANEQKQNPPIGKDILVKISNEQRRKISADLSRDSKFDLQSLQNNVKNQKPYRNMAKCRTT